MADNKEVEIKISVDTSDVEKSMKDVSKQAENMSKKIEKSGDKAEKSFDGLERSLKDVQKQVNNTFKNNMFNNLQQSMKKALNNVVNQTKSASQTIANQLKKALNIKETVDIKTNVTTDKSSGASGSSLLGGMAMGGLTGGAMGASIQKNLSLTKDKMSDVTTTLRRLKGEFTETEKKAMKFAKEVDAYDKAKGSYNNVAEEMKGQGLEIEAFDEAIIDAFERVQKAMDEATVDSKRSIRELVKEVNTLIELFNKDGLGNNKLTKDLEEYVGFLEKVSKLRGIGREATPVNAKDYEKANRILKITNGSLKEHKNLIMEIQHMSEQSKQNKVLGDQCNQIEKVRKESSKTQPVVTKLFNTLANNKAARAIISIGGAASFGLGRAIRWFKKFGSESKKAIDSVDKSSKKAKNAIKSLISQMLPILSLVGIFNTLKTSIGNAMESIETQNMFNTVFGSSANDMDAWVSKMNQTLGLGVTETKKYTATIMQMGKAMGLTGQDAMSMSQKMATMAGDISSFYDTDIVSVQEDLRSALGGSFETMDKYGVMLRQTTIEQYAYANGIAKVGSELTNAQRAMATTLLIEQSLGVANNDLARSINSPSNQARILRSNLYDLSVALGSCFTPILSVVLPILNRFVSALASTINTVASFISKLFSLFGVSVGGGGGGFLSDVTDSVGGIGDAIGDGLSNASGGASDVADELGKAKDNAKDVKRYLSGLDELNLTAESSASGSGSGSGGSGGSAGSGGSGGGGGIGGIGDIATSESENMFNKVGQEIEQWIKDIAEALKAVWGALSDGWMSVSDYISQSIANLKQAFLNLGEAIKNFLIGAWNNGGEELIYNFGRLAGAIVGAFIDVSAQVVQAVANLFNYLNPETNNVTKGFINALNKMLEASQAFILSIGSWFSTFMASGGQAFLNVLGDIVLLIGTILAHVLTDAVSLTTKFFNSWAGHVVIKTVAISLNVLAGVVKAVLIVIDKCRYAIYLLIATIGAFQLSKIINDFNTFQLSMIKSKDTVLTFGQKLAFAQVQFGGFKKYLVETLTAFKDFIVNGLKSAIQFTIDLGRGVANLVVQFKNLIAQLVSSAIKGIKNIFHDPIGSVKALGTALLNCAKSAISFGKSMIQSAWSAITGLVSTCASGVASLLGLSVAEGTATAGAVLLQVALSALGILAIIAAIGALIAVIKNWSTITAKISELWKKFMDFLGDRCPWLKAIFESLGKVFSWIGEKVGWLWDKVKGFFGWSSDSEDELTPSIEGLGDTIEETSERFGSSCSKMNEALNSVGIDSNKLGVSLDKAEQMYNESFNRMSKNAREYLDAVATGNEEVLQQMSADSGTYMEEILYTYQNMSNEEKAIFNATYGEIKGINDDWFNYTNKTYEEMVLAHTSMLQQIENNEELSAQEKDRRLAEETEKFKQAQTDRLTELNLALANMDTMTFESEDARLKYERDIMEERKTVLDGIAGKHSEVLTNAEDASKKASDAIGGAYEDMSKSEIEALESVDKALGETQKSLNSFKDESDKVAQAIPDAWKGIGQSITTEFTTALTGVTTAMETILANTRIQCDRLKEGLRLTFSEITSGIQLSMSNLNQDMTSQFTLTVSSIIMLGNQLKENLQTILMSISEGVTLSFTTIKTTITNTMTQILTTVNTNMVQLNSKVRTYLQQLQQGIQTTSTTIKTNITNTINLIKQVINNGMQSMKDAVNRNMDSMLGTINTKTAKMVQAIKDCVKDMKEALDVDLPTPRLKMPHIKQNGSWNLETGQTPSWSVKICTLIWKHMINKPTKIGRSLLIN